MGNDRELLTLLQISDLHFGDKLGGHGVDQLSAGLPWLISRFSHFDGLLGHHYKALSALHDFYKRLWGRHPTCPVIVTGDITANGAALIWPISTWVIRSVNQISGWDWDFHSGQTTVYLGTTINGLEVT